MRIQELFESLSSPRASGMTLQMPVLFRAETSRTRYPVGTFWTLSSTIADHYSRKTREATYRKIQVYVPRSLNLFSVDRVLEDHQFRISMLDDLEQWASQRGFSSDDLENMRTYDVLKDREPDFAYPVRDDVEYLRGIHGFDGVFYSMEGGMLVDTVFLFGDLPIETRYLTDVIEDENDPIHDLVLNAL